MNRVLIAEDNPANMELLTEMLERWGFEVVGATNGHEAFIRLISALPDVALVDIQMPGSDGYELIQRIRKEPRLKELRVVALTAFAMRGDRESILAHGFDAYLTKPIDFQQLRAELQKMDQARESTAGGEKRP